MNHQDSINQRAHDRFRIAVAVQVQPEPGAEIREGESMNCLTRDISLSGMCIYAETELPADTSLLLSIDLGQPPKTFNLLGKVIWSAADKGEYGAYMIGINLVKLPGDTVEWRNAVIQMLVG